MRKLQSLWVLLLLGMWGCKPSESVKPDPPAGSFVYGSEYNDLAGGVTSNGSDGFTIIAGQAREDNEGMDLWLADVSSSGDIQQELWLDSDGTYFIPQSILRLNDGNYVATWYSLPSPNVRPEIHLGKFSSQLQLLWDKSYSQEGNYDANRGVSGLWALGSGYLLSFNVANQAVLLRTDASGKELWRTYLEGDVPYETRKFATLGADKNIYVGVFDYNYGSVRMLKIDSIGITQQNVALNGGNNYYGSYCLAAAPDSSIHLVEFIPWDGTATWWKIEPDLFTMSSRTLQLNGGTTNGAYPVDMEVKDDGSLHILLSSPRSNYYYGYGEGTQSNSFYYIINADGTERNSFTFGGDETDYCKDMAFSNGRTALVGSSSSYGAGGTDTYLVITTP